MHRLHGIPYCLRHTHKSYKEKGCARTFNAIVNNRGFILDSTDGHPGSWNDKQLVKEHRFAGDLQHGKYANDVMFHLYGRATDNSVERVCYRGPWLITDGGYLEWATNVPPSKDEMHPDAYKLSKWIESLRKDVECVFGRLKKRFLVFKTPVRLYGVTSTDDLWMICLALHNIIHLHDEEDNPWNVDSDSDLDNEAVDAFFNEVAVDADGSQDGDDNDSDDDDEGPIQPTPTNEVPVNSGCAPSDFRDRLVVHFMLALERNEVMWPQRLSTHVPTL